MAEPPAFPTLIFSDNCDHADPRTSIDFTLGGKAIEKIEIGKSADNNIDITAIEYAGSRAMASGPGGDHLSPQTVLNTVQPTGILNYFKWYEVVVGIREDVFTALYDTDVSDSLKAVEMGTDNPILDYFTITKKSIDGTSTTYILNGTRVANVSQSNLKTEDGRFIVEVKFTITNPTTLIFYDDCDHSEFSGDLRFYDDCES